MPIHRFYEWAAYFSIERANYNQMEVNIARIARDIHNKTYQKKLELDSFLEIPELRESNHTQEEFDMNMAIIRNTYKRAGMYK